MLSISTVPEALHELSEGTGRAWTESELFDIASNRGIHLHAAFPYDASKNAMNFALQDGRLDESSTTTPTSILVILFPFQTAQLWINGATESSHPDVGTPKGIATILKEPVRVTRADVRLKSKTILQILQAWNDAQRGVIHKATLPEWMRPAITSEQAKTTKPPRGILKSQALTAFESVVGTCNLKKLLADKPKWILGACLDRGKKGTREGIWNPVILAIALMDRKYAQKPKLTNAFHTHNFLSHWRDEWIEKSNY